MIVAYLLGLALAALVYLMTARLAMPTRLALSIGTFVVLAAVITFVIVRIGDKPSDGSVVVTPEQLKEQAGKQP